MKRPDASVIARHQAAAGQHLLATLAERPTEGSVAADRRMLLDMAFAEPDERIAALALTIRNGEVPT